MLGKKHSNEPKETIVEWWPNQTNQANLKRSNQILKIKRNQLWRKSIKCVNVPFGDIIFFSIPKKAEFKCKNQIHPNNVELANGTGNDQMANGILCLIEIIFYGEKNLQHNQFRTPHTHTKI